GYAFEAELLLRAARSGWEIAELPVRVIYPPGDERVSHFHAVRDPARIVYRVLESTLLVPRRGVRRRFLSLLLALVLALGAAHFAVDSAARPTPPRLPVSVTLPLVSGPGFRALGRSYAFERGRLIEVGLYGDPPSIGTAHARLLHEPMLEN